MQQHPFSAVQEKAADQKGLYVDPQAHSQPQSKGFGYDANQESSLTQPKISEPAKATVKTVDKKIETPVKVVPQKSTEKQSID